jgi:hypothetical protein
VEEEYLATTKKAASQGRGGAAHAKREMEVITVDGSVVTEEEEGKIELQGKRPKKQRSTQMDQICTLSESRMQLQQNQQEHERSLEMARLKSQEEIARINAESQQRQMQMMLSFMESFAAKTKENEK